MCLDKKKVLRNKKGNAGVFVFVLAALLLIYMVLLPETVLKDVIDLDHSSSADNTAYYPVTTSSSNVLINSAPGSLSPERRTDYEYLVPSISLFRTTESVLMGEEKSFFVKRSWFITQNKVVDFYVDDKRLVNNFILSFNAPLRSGILFIKVNGESIYEKKIDKESPEPVQISLNKIRDGKNELEFSVSSVGMFFWSVNEMNIENLVLYADLTDTSRGSTRSTFFIPRTLMNIESSDLRFVPECSVASVGILTVKLNERILSESVPECGTLNRITINPSYLKEGSNNLEFQTAKGSYLLDRIKVNTKLRQTSNPTYYFFIDDKMWENIRSPEYVANLSIKFLVPENKYIDLKVNVNNENFGIYEFQNRYHSDKITIDDYSYSLVGYERGNYHRILDGMLKRGNNVIRLEPQDDVDIISIKLEVERLKKTRSSNTNTNTVVRR